MRLNVASLRRLVRGESALPGFGRLTAARRGLASRSVNAT
jgi:hypothetical protein